MYSVGVIGFGVVGLAGLKFFIQQSAALRTFLKLAPGTLIQFFVWDQKEPLVEHQEIFAEHGVVWVSQEQCSLPDFLKRVDRALVSPGVNLSQVESQEQIKIFCELDLFSACFAGRSIAITGSLGKTTITKLIYQIFMRYHASLRDKTSVALGGNVGISMLDLVREQQADWAVLELSSYQLERSNLFIPVVGVWTNLYPNHLDRHGDLKGYFQAKAKLLGVMQLGTSVVLGSQLFDQSLLPMTIDLIDRIKSDLIIAGDVALLEHVMMAIPRHQFVMWSVRDKMLIKQVISKANDADVVFSIDIALLPACTFVENWATIFSALDAAGVDLAWLARDIKDNPSAYQPNDHKHRVEFIRQYRGIDMYNDSKSTVQEATIAAVQQLVRRYARVHVVIGGLSKGVDRSMFGALLRQQPAVLDIVAFGKEAEMLGVQQRVATLEAAIQEVLINAAPGDAILFSPGGASFDLFKNYEHRGECFREIVVALPT